MCTTDYYPYLNADGTANRKVTRCDAYLNGHECTMQVYHHPRPIPIPIRRPSTTAAAGGYLPPSPRLTPGSNLPSPRLPSGSFQRGGPSTPLESDSDVSSRRRPRSVNRIYVNGHRVDIVDEPASPRDAPPSSSSHRRNRSYESSGSRRDSRSGGRIVVVEAPPTTRTPPQNYSIPRTAPPSPAHGHEALRHRPVIVDERPERRVRIEVPAASNPHPPAFSDSSSGRDGRGRGGSRRQQASSDESERRRERRSEKEREQRLRERSVRREGRDEAEEEARRRRREARIAKANIAIAQRGEQPLPPRRSATTYVRPTVEVPGMAGLGLVEGMGGLNVRGSWEEEEEEARKQRLRERMMPNRRASIGAGSRRVRVEYGDGMYRLE
ncbi:uncharacterized protein DNG_07245 [Cephalotrichum gorgonifer]|uniref:Uncharacterized protein n=1 Tax=Cephalotrichum gorgonifer TaxID=2041049 RepID=A0AAE8SX80_9PEZI|nr:uncharacterized protein DNG_07245 [Cephalotrichum gorgonifer]